ncbi:MAG: hypothetical protein WC374_13420 [Phycisphaerae bacterium]|jgi:hypothetical protein
MNKTSLIQAVNEMTTYSGISAARGKDGELVYFNHRVIGAPVKIGLSEAASRLFKWGVVI